MNLLITFLPFLFTLAHAGHLSGSSLHEPQADDLKPQTHSVFNDAIDEDGEIGAGGDFAASAHASGYGAASAAEDGYEATALSGGYQFDASPFSLKGVHPYAVDELHSAGKSFNEASAIQAEANGASALTDAHSEHLIADAENFGKSAGGIDFPANHQVEYAENHEGLEGVDLDEVELAGHDFGDFETTFGAHELHHKKHEKKHEKHEKHHFKEIHHHHKLSAKVVYKDTPIHVSKPYIKTVDHPYGIKIPVSKPIAVPEVKELKITIEKHIPVKVEKKVPFKIEKHVPYKVIKHIPVYVPKPYPVKVPIYKKIIHKVKSSKKH